MTALSTEDIIKFLKTGIEPLPDSIYGDGYSASVTLTDGLYLASVLFCNAPKRVDLAVSCFKEE